MLSLKSIEAMNTEAGKGTEAHEGYAWVGVRGLENLNSQAQTARTGATGRSSSGGPSIGPAVSLGTLLPAALTLVAVGGSLVIGAALLGFAIPLRYLDGTAAVQLIVLFLSAGVLTAGIHGRCPACRKLFARQFVRETVRNHQGYQRAVPRAEAALNVDRMTGYIKREKPIHGHTKTHVSHFRCAYCHHDWTVAEQRQS
jgi:hypothetical protein